MQKSKKTGIGPPILQICLHVDSQRTRCSPRVWREHLDGAGWQSCSNK